MNRIWTYCGLIMIFLMAGPIVVPHGGGSLEETRGEKGGYFGSERIYESTSRVLSGGMDIGDVDGDGEMEVAVCDFKGVLFLLDPDGKGGFTSRTIWEEKGAADEKTLFEVKIWDFLPEREGLEMVVGGYSRNITMIYYEDGDWTSDVIYRSPHRIFNMAVADVDEAPGMEILFASDKYPEDWNIRYIARDGEAWTATEIETDGGVRSITHSDVDSTVFGPEIYVTTKNWIEGGGGRTESSVVQIYNDGEKWVRQKIFTNPEYLIANIRAGDIWSLHDGNEIIAVDFDGNCTMIWEESGVWKSRLIFQTKDITTGGSYPLEGMVVGEFNPLNENVECMVSGYYNKVNQVVDIDGTVLSDLAWSTDFTDVRLEISGVEMGDILPERPGNEVIIASFQGWVEILYFEEDGVELNLDFGEVQVEVGDTEEASFEVVPKGFASGPVQVEIDEVEGVTFQLPFDLTISDHQPVRVYLTIMSTGQVTNRVARTVGVNVTVNGIRVRDEFDLIIVPAAEDVSLQLTYSSGYAYREIPTVLSSAVSVQGADFLDIVELEVTNVPGGVVANCDTPISPSGSANLLVTVNSDAAVGKYNIGINAKHEGNVLSSTFYSLEIGTIEDQLETSMSKGPGGDNMYVVLLNFTGPKAVPAADVKLFLLGSIRYSNSHDLERGSLVEIKFSIEKDVEDEEVGIEVSKLGTRLYQGSLGEVSFSEEKKEEGSAVMIVIFILVIIVAVALIVFVFSRYRKEGGFTGDESLQGVGGARRYNIRETERMRGRAPDRSGVTQRPGIGRKAPDRSGVTRSPGIGRKAPDRSGVTRRPGIERKFSPGDAGSKGYGRNSAPVRSPPPFR